jgi:zinc protease
VLEGDAKGYISIGSILMSEGTINRSKAELDEQIDFIGASLSTFPTGISASSLSRHTETLLELMTDVLYHPSFSEAELQRLINQRASALATVPADANSILANVSLAAVFGPEHPSGEIITQESLANITIEQIREYHHTYFRPNVAYMVIVGDIDALRARELMDRHFAQWEAAEVPRHHYHTPLPPEGRRVVFAERPAAIQSSVSVTYPVVLPPGHEDAIAVSVMNAILGGSFTSRLMQNLREDKGYTYGASSSLTTNSLVSRFRAGTSVRNNVTASAIEEILYEMKRLIDEPVDEGSLEMIKNYLTGNFARSLESPATIAGFALSVKRYDLPKDYYATYLQRLNQVTASEVQKVASSYLKPDNVIIVVVGNREEVANELIPFSASNKVEFFDAFGRQPEKDPPPFVPGRINQ